MRETSNQVIRLKQKHILCGVKKSRSECPIALAIRDNIPGEYFLEVHSFSVQIGEDYFTLPKSAKAFIEKFDVGLKVSPFEFDIGY